MSKTTVPNLNESLRRATIKDVAKHAGVSIATVSRIINEKKGVIEVAEETRKRIELAMSELDYNPCFLARGFKTRNSNTFGIIVGDLKDGFYSEVLAGIEQGCRERNYLSIILGAAEKSEKNWNYLTLFKQRRIDGLILAGETAELDIATLKELCGNRVPLVQIARNDASIPTIVCNEIAGMERGINYLISLGHKKISYLGSTERQWSNHNRLEGYLRAMDRANLKADIISGIRYANDIRPMIQESMHNKRFSAIACFNDETGAVVIRAINQIGYSVPHDISVIGFDNIQISEFLSPALTTIAPQRFRMGVEATRILFELFNEHQLRSNTVELDCDLIIRESSTEYKK